MLTLQKGKINTMEVKNRIFYAPMGYGLDGYGPRGRTYFEDRCKGGAGMIFTHYCVLAGADAFMSNTPADHDKMKAMAAMAHSYGTKACMQLFLGYGRVQRYLISGLKDDPKPIYSASAVPEFYYEDKICAEYTADELKEQLVRVGEAAKFIGQESGYDCIEVHAYGGYLADCFLTERWNKRTDEYGGKDIKARSKYVTDIIKKVRENVGPDFPIIVKFTPCHFIDEAGYRKIDEGLELAKIFEDAGVDAMHVDAGCYDNWELCMPPAYQQEQSFAVTAAEQVKKIVNVPVMTAGKLGYPERGEQALKDGKCDFLVIGRGMLADPEYPNKLAEGRICDIRPCIGCEEGCIGNNVMRNESIACAVNPDTGFETYRKVPLAAEPKKMLVIGAGIGGLTFAYDAAVAGHHVEIWEKRTRIGGLLTAAGRPSFKKEVNDLVEYYKVQLTKLGVNVRYGVDASADDILAYGADEVVLAMGCGPVVPKSIPGIDKLNVVTVVDALNDTATIGKNVVIVGAGLVGCEAAMHFSNFGKKIDMIEMAPHTMPGEVFIQCRRMVDNRISADENITVHTSTKLLSIQDDGVIVEKNGKEVRIPCDTVMLALGLKPVKSDLYEQLKDKTSVRVIDGGLKVLDSTASARVTLLQISGLTEADYTRPGTMW